MSLILSGTDGLSDVDGTAATPAIRGTDTNTGIFFPAADTVAASVGGTEGLRLTTTGLGVGTSTPGAKLDVNGASYVRAGNVLRLYRSDNATYGDINNGGSGVGLKYNDANGDGHTFQNSGATIMRLDSSGRLGLGVTPSAWDLGKAIEVGTVGNSIWGIGSSNMVVGSNIYYASSSYKYANTAAASAYQQAGGVHYWYNAASGTAGNSISFTQAMTLDASGRLLAGVTTASSGARATFGSAAQASGASCADSGIFLSSTANLATGEYAPFITWSGNATNPSRARAAIGAVSTSTTTALDLVFLTRSAADASEIGTGSERARITSAGYLLVGTTAAAGDARLVVNNPDNVSGDFCLVTYLGSNCNNTSSYHYIAVTGGADKFYLYGNGNVVNTNGSYGTLSDVKLKENIVDATPKLADVMRLQVRNFNLKTEPGHKQIGFVAQEFEQVFPAMVDESPDRDANGNTLETTTKHIKTSVLVPILVKAIQEQQAIIESLTARITALEAK